MKKRLARLSVCAIAMLASACQPRTKTRIITVTVPESPITGGTELVDFKKQTYGTPLLARLSDAECQGRKEAVSMQSAAVQGVWYGYQDLDEQTISVTTKILDSRTYEQELTNKTDLRYIIQSDKKELKLCSGTSVPQSLEHIGTLLKQAADRAAAFYTQVQTTHPDLKMPKLPPVGVGLLPQYKKDVKRIDQVIKLDGSKTQNATQTITTQTDNAFYSPFADETLSPNIYAISVIPQSAEARQQGLFNGKGLWEFPVVFQHEYGHHVFQMLFGDSTVLSFVNYMDYWNRHQQLHAIHGSLARTDIAQNPEEDKERRAFLSSPGYIFSAMNEGFADLFAYYSLGETKGLFDITCFAQTREVPEPIMFGGINKVWNEQIWSETFNIGTRTGADLLGSKDNKTPIEICSTPSFDDIHVMGAVIAHTVDAAFSTVVKAKSPQTPSLEKAALLIQWIQELRATDEVMELSNKQTLSRVLNSALGTAKRALGESDKQAFCEVVQTRFPVLITRWQDKTYEDEAGILKTCALD